MKKRKQMYTDNPTHSDWCHMVISLWAKTEAVHD